MFYSQYVLAKKGPLGKIWLAAHMEKKLQKVQVISTNIPESIDNIENPTVRAPRPCPATGASAPTACARASPRPCDLHPRNATRAIVAQVPMALRMSGHLLLGVVRIFSRKVAYLYTDASEAMVKINDAFDRQGGVDLAPGAATRRYDDITNPENFDEMDLDAGLSAQHMSFAMDDDALAGITVPDDALGDITMADGNAGFEEGAPDLDAENGFGHENNFQAFFEDEADAPEAPAEKRRRTSDLPGKETMRSGDDEDEENLPPREVARSAAGPDESEALDHGGVSMDGAGDFGAGMDGAGDFGAGQFEEFGDEDMPGPSAMEDVMNADGAGKTRRSSMGASSVAASQMEDEGASQGVSQGAAKSRKAPKRKMLIDDELQITKEQMNQLRADTSALVRDLTAGAKSKARAPAPDLFSGPPDLSLLPPEALELACFQPGYAAARKQARRGKHAAASLEPDDAEVQQPTTLEEDTEVPQAGEQEFGGMDETQFVGDEPMQFEEEPWGGAAEEEEEEGPAPPPAFDTKTQLPDVDANEVAEKDKDAATQSSADAWGARTQKMHAMLANSFTESEGQALSFNAMIAASRGKGQRHVVAGCFQELLFLTTHGHIKLQQHKPYENIVISKCDVFDSVTTAATPAAASAAKSKSAGGRRKSR